MEVVKISLWTRQTKDSLEDLLKKGVYRAKEQAIKAQYEDIFSYYLELYQWFIEAANKRVQRPSQAEYPVWCSISRDYMLRPIPGTLVYELEVNREDVLLFDAGKWDLILNHRYIPKDDRDEETYRKHLKEKGFPEGTTFIEERMGRRYPAERARVIDSWERVFSLKEETIFSVQANIWEIKLEQVVRVSTNHGVYEKADLLDLAENDISVL